MTIFINGCGVVGRPLAYGLKDLGYSDIYVSAKGSGDNPYDRNEKERLAVMLKKTGYNLLIAEGGDKLDKFHEYEMTPLGYVNDFHFNELSIIVDGTPNDKTAQMQKDNLYDKLREEGWQGSVIYSGGSKYGIAPNYLGSLNCIGETRREKLLGKDVRNVSCNSTYLGKLFSIIGQAIDWKDVQIINTDLFRRSRDIFEGQSKQLVDPQYEPKTENNRIKKTKYVDDVMSICPELNPVKYFTIEPYQLPTEIAHLVNTTLTFKEPMPDSIDDIKDAIYKAPNAILFNNSMMNMDKVGKLAEIKMGVPYFQITAPIYWPLRLNDIQVKITGLTPQMTIDRESKLIKIVEETKGFDSFRDSFSFVMNNVKEMNTDIPLIKFNKEFQEVLEKHH